MGYIVKMIPRLKILWISFLLIHAAFGQNAPKLNSLSIPEHLTIASLARLLCVASSGDQPIDFHWLKDGIPFSAGKNEQLNEWTSQLTIQNLALDHIGNYTCRASNLVGADHVTARLFVTAPPQWILEPSNLQVRKGKNALFNCKAEGSPKVKIEWLKQSESQSFNPIFSNNNFHVFENGSLQISRVQTSNSGIYVCVAMNGIGTNLQQRVQLLVYDYPIVERNTDHVVVEKGQTAHISCSAKGDAPLSFSWMKDFIEYTEIGSRASFSDVVEGESVVFSLSIVSTIEEDRGLYSCIAKNEFGSDRKDIRLMLVERPKAPHSVELVDIWSTSARIKWALPDDGNSPILGYTVEFWTNPGGHYNITTSSSSLSCILRNLRPNTLYNFHVWASNFIGDSNPSQQGQFTTAKEEPTAPPIDVRIEHVGSTFIQISWKPPPQEYWNGELVGFYVGYKQSSVTPFTYNTVDWDENHPYNYILRGLRRATSYLITVRAFNEVGSGPPSEEISFKTQNQEPVPQPILLIQDIGSTFIQINWMISDDVKSATVGYTVYYRKAGAKWMEINIPDSYQNAYTITNLDSGTSYQAYITSHGSTGISEPSDIATVRTSPEAIYHPVLPTQAQSSMDDVTQVLYIVVPVAVSSVIIVVVIVSACVYVYSRRPIQLPHTYGDLPASKNFSYMSTVPRPHQTPVTICSGNSIKYGSPYSTVPLTRPELEEDEPIYESVVGDTLRKVKQRCFEDEYRIPTATVV